MSVDYIKLNGEKCPCGKEHSLTIESVYTGKGAVYKLPEALSGYKKVFILCDTNTYEAAGKLVKSILDENGIENKQYIFPDKHLKPDEKAVGSAVMHFDNSCDAIVGVGSGVINDIGKILSSISNRRYIIVGTAPSMDGYASLGSSMDLDGVKTSVNSRCPNVIIGDTDILKNAPIKMLKSGLGDMMAKLISIAEWRIAHILVGEYYCENVAKLMRSAVKRCTDNAEGLLKRDEEAVEAVFEGLVIGGAAMAYAGISRPASGIEHYFSHVWDMRGLEFGEKTDFHGIQCAVGTLYAAKLYEKLIKVTPDKEKAIKFTESFDLDAYNASLRNFLGKGADTMIELEKKEQKYSLTKHRERLDKIIDNWDEIIKIIKEEIPSAEYIENLLSVIDAPKTAEDIGLTSDILPRTFNATKDIRDKYVLSRLCWDLGISEEFAESLKN